MCVCWDWVANYLEKEDLSGDLLQWLIPRDFFKSIARRNEEGNVIPTPIEAVRALTVKRAGVGRDFFRQNNSP